MNLPTHLSNIWYLFLEEVDTIARDHIETPVDVMTTIECAQERYAHRSNKKKNCIYFKENDYEWFCKMKKNDLRLLNDTLKSNYLHITLGLLKSYKRSTRILLG